MVTGVLAFIYLICGSVAGHYSSEWDEWVDAVSSSASVHEHLENIRGALGATCVC